MEREVNALLDSFFSGASDLGSLHEVQSSLRIECSELERRSAAARSQAREAAGQGFSQMQTLAGSLDLLSRRIKALQLQHRPSFRMIHELSELAEEVGRVGEVKAYVGAALQLERFVGDLEDDVFAAASKTPVLSLGGRKANPGQSATRLATAVNTLKSIETTMFELANSKPQWERLLSAVDVRVDRAIAALRPVAIADYRAVLMSVGWPPSLTGSKVDGRHPLALLQGEAKRRYRESFVSLSALQTVQARRIERSTGIKEDRKETLLSFEELVVPIAAKCEVHFKKWLDKPGFVFALAYRTALEHVGVVDSVLQPMLDEGGLSYSAREEWVSAVVNMVAEHLRNWALPTLLRDLENDQLSKLWLHTVDQALDFDRKMQALALTGMAISNAVLDEGLSGLKVQVFGVHRPCISAFADRAEWLELWGQFEREDARAKLKSTFENEASWKVNPANFEGQTLPLASASSGEFKPPVAAQRAMSTMWTVIERCKTLPEADQRLKFVRSAACPVFEELLEELRQRCHEVEALKAISDEESMVKVGVCINCARYCENILKEWCEDMYFLELKLAEQHENLRSVTEADATNLQGTVFDTELGKASQFRSAWLAKLSSAISRSFEAHAREYTRNKRKWLEVLNVEPSDSAELRPSRDLVDALAVLQNQLALLKETLDRVNFLELWQKLIPALDHLVFQGVVMSGARFTDQAGEQFAQDVKSLFLVFKPYCLRPASFFVYLADGMRVLSMPREDALSLLEQLCVLEVEEDEDEQNKLLNRYGIRRLTSAITHKILSCRID